MKNSFTYLVMQDRRGAKGAARFPVSPHVLDLGAQHSPTPQRSEYFGQVFAFGVMLCLFATSFGLASGKITNTVSYFRDDEVAQNNIFRAGLLGFRVDAFGDGYTFEGPEDIDGGFHTALVIPDTGSISMRYRITTEKTSGSDAFCSALRAVSTSTAFIYDGPLLGFGTTTTLEGPHEFDVRLSSAEGLIDGDICNVDVVYLGWSDSSPTPFGYTDTKRVPLSFSYLAPVQNFSTSAFSETPPQEDTPQEPPPLETTEEIPVDPPQDTPPAPEQPQESPPVEEVPSSPPTDPAPTE
jgi:hypothetical protein